jgi:hypothetical protein
MIRAIVAGGLLIAALAILAFVPGYLQQASNDQHKPPCDLLAGPCSWQTSAGSWQVRLAPGPEGSQGVEYQLQVTVPEAPDRFLAVLRGENMYMGEYPVPLVREASREYRARFTAPFCTTGNDMVWRIDLQDGQDLIENAPSTLVFRAEK